MGQTESGKVEAGIKTALILASRIKLAPAAAKWRDFTEATAKNRIGSTGFNGPDVLNLTPVSVSERRRRFYER